MCVCVCLKAYVSIITNYHAVEFIINKPMIGKYNIPLVIYVCSNNNDKNASSYSW